MKVAVECKSPLLQKSLELFLSRHLCSSKHCDIVVRDVKCVDDEKCFYISSDSEADMTKPFSKSQLILALENRYKITNNDGVNKSVEVEEYLDKPLNFDILEKRIESLTTEYQQNILKAIRAFYEK